MYDHLSLTRHYISFLIKLIDFKSSEENFTKSLLVPLETHKQCTQYPMNIGLKPFGFHTLNCFYEKQIGSSAACKSVDKKLVINAQ
jgi:hypothetical protein